jgi:mannose-6-phosphate isomerase-like protein (cupin superfamily)
MGLIRPSDGVVDEPQPGLSRLTLVHRPTGAGALTVRIVTVGPGVATRLHWHKIEEAMLVLEGRGQAVLGDEVMDIAAGETLLGPARIRHGFVNPGPEPMKLVVAFPAVEVETFFE